MEPPTLSSAKLTDFVDLAGANAPLESVIAGQDSVFSIIDAESRSSSSIARFIIPSTEFRKFEFSVCPALLLVAVPDEFVPNLRAFSLSIRTEIEGLSSVFSTSPLTEFWKFELSKFELSPVPARLCVDEPDVKISILR